MSQANVQAIQNLYAKAEQGDMQAALQMLDPDIVVHEQESLPYGGTYNGYEGYQQLFTNLMGVWDDFKFNPQQFIDGGDYVIAIIQLQGRAKSTGKSLDMRMLELWQMRDGRGVDCVSLVYDTAKMLELLS